MFARAIDREAGDAPVERGDPAARRAREMIRVVVDRDDHAHEAVLANDRADALHLGDVIARGRTHVHGAG